MSPRRVALLVSIGMLACIAFGGVALFGAFMGGQSKDGGGTGCSTDVDQAAPAAPGPTGVGGLTAAQLANAGAVIAEGRRLHIPDRGILIALATASQESHFTNYANDGKGSDLLFFQTGVGRSLQLPHEAVGSDHGSVGIFQQQYPWWGTLHDLMDPATSAKKFYWALAHVHGWQAMPVTVAAQRVQRSAYPNAYADDETLARSLLSGTPTPGAPVGSSTVEQAAWASGSTACVRATDPGHVVFPLPRTAAYRDNHNYGSHGSHWARMHTGDDLSVACGTPVLAATDGTVVIRTDQPWAGRWLVQVSTGIGQLTTWYGHMRGLDVTDGEQVTAGQQIGEVGDLGNATGCHLHFEVHPRGGSIYQDSVNPSSWLSAHVGQQAGQGVATTVQAAAGSRSSRDWFTVATFNVLGDSHTRAGGKEAWRPSGPTRMRGVVQLLAKYGVDVVGFQEFQRSQRRAFLAQAGGTYAVWSPPGDTENSIAWRRDRFQLVAGRTLSIPYFDGHHRRMPVVRLLDLHTGKTAVFMNVHNPADTGRYPHQGHWRSVAVSLETRLVHSLSAGSGMPVLVTGDMNDRRSVYCRYTANGGTHSARSPTAGAGCRVPAHPEIDWIFGSSAVQFSDYTKDHGHLVRWTTDHPLVLARAHVG